MTAILTAARIACVAFAVAATVPAYAGGDDYDAANDTEGHGPVYYGFVRDNRGAPVADARVVLQPKAGGEPTVIKSNVLGLYRSHVSNKFKPEEISVSCDKSGYSLQKVARRAPQGTSEMNIETNCTMQRL